VVAADVLEGFLDVPEDRGLVSLDVTKALTKKEPVNAIVGVATLGHVDCHMSSTSCSPLSEPPRSTPGMEAKDRRKKVNRAESAVDLGYKSGKDVTT
jgi:hypothetical protein